MCIFIKTFSLAIAARRVLRLCKLHKFGSEILV
nr:MAG TPA: hypothetical protein [Caudoviricetes sp.]